MKLHHHLYSVDNEQAAKDAAAWQEYSDRELKVFCVICERVGQGSQLDLEMRGWTLNEESELCPAHQLRRAA